MAVRTVLFSALLLVGCGAPVSRGARAQEAAQDYNIHTRFGRMEVASEKIAPKARETFAATHRGWHGSVRIADLEMAAIKLTSDTEADVVVRVAWFKPNEQELRTTTLRQKWKDFRGDWMLISEERSDGDMGLLGEEVPAASTRAKQNAQFPTIKLGKEKRDTED